MSNEAEHRAQPWGCGCWTVCSCGFHPEMTDDMTPLLGRQIVAEHVKDHAT
jgi:hypothetical protein